MSAESSLPVQIATDPVHINNVFIDSRYSNYPLLVYNDLTYLPLTWDMSRFVGLNTAWTAAGGLQLTRGITAAYKSTATRLNQPGYTYYADAVFFPINIHGAEVAGDEIYPWLFFRGITYMPLTWDNVVNHLGWQITWEVGRGLYIRSNQRSLSGDDLQGHLSSLLSKTLLQEYHFVAGYLDQYEEMWLQGEVHQEYLGSSAAEAGILQIRVDADNLFWYQDVEMFSRFNWQIPLDLSKAASYSQYGGRRPEYEQNTAFGETPLAQFPLLIFNEKLLSEPLSVSTPRWSEMINDNCYSLELRSAGTIGLQSVEMTLAEDDAEKIEKLVLQGSWLDADGLVRIYRLIILCEELTQNEEYSFPASPNAAFLQPLLLDDGGLILLSGDGRIARTNRNGETLWSYSAEPQLYGRAMDNAGNLYVWSYQKLWCINPYGRLMWQRSVAVRSLEVQDGWLLVSRNIGEQVQWDVLYAASGWREFTFPEGCKQVVWLGSLWLGLGERSFSAYSAYGELLWQKALPTPSLNDGYFFGWQYSLLAAKNERIVIHQQGVNSSKILVYDASGNLLGESAGFSSSCVVEPAASGGVYLYDSGALYYWTPGGGAQLWQRNLAAVPNFLADGSFISRGAYQQVQLVDAANKLLWQAQLGWAAQYSGPFLITSAQVVALAGRDLVCYSVDGEFLWRLTLGDFQQMPTQMLADEQNRAVIWNAREVFVVDEQGRVRWSYGMGR